MATIKLIDEQVDEITLIDSNNKYKNGQRAKDGKTFSRYRYDGKVFTVDNESPFITAFNASTIDSVKLIEGTRDVITVNAAGEEETTTAATLTYDSFVSFAATLNRAAHKSKVARYQHLATAPVTSEMLEDLVNG
jgi:hypothetical protein